MYVKTVDGNYYNLLTGSTVEVREANASTPENPNFRLMVTSGTVPVTTLQQGYRSKEDAQDALDDVFASQDLIEIAPPDYPEEDEAQSDEDLVESEEEIFDNYDELNNEQLRALLNERQLSTTGNKSELIARLRESDQG
jgi:predicted dienelactone hydrolase